MMFGHLSIRNSLLRWGFPVHDPVDDAIYYNGGYNIETFSGHGLGAIQIECPTSILEGNIDLCAAVIAFSVDVFRKKFC